MDDVESNKNKSFVEQHAAVVLKLKIKAVDGTTQIRRIKVERLATKNGDDGSEISFEELRRLSINFSFGDKITNYDDYVVALTYYDSDNDMVSIGSKEELMDAIEQFSNETPPVLRITSYVSRSTTGYSTLGSGSGGIPVTDQTTGRGTSTRGGNVPAPIAVPAPVVAPNVPVQKVLEAFVGVLSTAVHHIQEGLTTTTHPPNVAFNNTANTSVPTTSSTSETCTGDHSASVGTEAAGSVKTTTQPEPENTTTITEDVTGSGPPSSGSSNQMPSNGVHITEESRPFIHGRHTCDSCLSTPIIGKRYHSVNLPDYDLCQNCFNNYKGSDIQFESVELDRDRPFQDRWHRRHHRNLSLRLRAAVRGSRCGGGRYGHGPRGGPRGLATRLEASGLPSRSTCQHPMTAGLRRHAHKLNAMSHRVAQLKPAPVSQASGTASQNVPASSVPPGASETEFDNALKEAIRRSLSDIAIKEAELISDIKKADDDEAAAADDESETFADANEEEETNDVAVVETVLGNEDEEDDHEQEAALSVKKGSDIPRSVDVPNDLSQRELEDSKDYSSLHGMEGMEEAIANILKNAMEHAMDAVSVDSEKMVEHEDIRLGEGAKHQTTGGRSPLSYRSSSKKTDQSFSSDAVGNGDVAEAIGATLDMVVGQISAMLDEQDSNTANEPSPGELIMDSNYPTATDGEQNETDGDWSVVKSVVSTESHATTDEAQIARAASILGNALFNSDMRSSIENASSKVSAVSGESRSVSSFSVPSSVPTDIGANNSASSAQLVRWSRELEQLRGLGFDDDKIIEVLERLSAANIGVDSEEELSLDLVVNKLLEKQTQN